MEMREQVPGVAGRTATVGTARGADAGDRVYVDWSGIIGGATVAVALGAVFAGFGGALGLTVVSAEEGEGSGLMGVIVSTVFILLSMVASYAAGGYIAGRMRRQAETATDDEVKLRDGMNGLVVWGLGTIVSVMVLGSIISGAVSTAGNVAATAGEAAGNAVAGLAEGAGTAASAMTAENGETNPIEWVTGSLLRPTTPPLPGAANGDTSADAMSILGNVMATGEISDADRTWLVQATANRTGLAPAEVEERVNQAVSAAQAARDEAARLATEVEETARDVAETARISAILTAFLLTATSLVAAVAAYVGAVRGGRHRDQGKIFGGFDWQG